MAKKNKVVEYFIPDNKTIEIEFDKLSLCKTDEYNTIHMQIGNKRIYSKMSDIICRSNNEILALDEENKNEVLYTYFCIKKALDECRFMTPKQKETDLTAVYKNVNNHTVDSFIEYLITRLFTPRFVNIIREYVNRNYSDEIAVDEELKANKREYNEGTTFTDKHFKIFYVTTCMSRFAIPLCMHYIYINDDINCYKDEFIYKVLKSLIKLAESGESTDLLRKLYYYTEQNIKKTGHTNAIMWDRIRMFNKTKESVNSDLVVKIINTAIPKFSFDKRIINFIKVISRETIEEYTLRAKDKYKIHSISAPADTGDEEDELSENDVFDRHYTKQDETHRLFNKYANDDAVAIIAKNNGVIFDPAEVEFYEKTVQWSLIQQFLVVQAFSNKFKGVKNIMSCSRSQFIKLMIILTKKMTALGLNELKHYVTGIRVSHSHIRKPSTMLLNSLYNDPIFEDLCNTKYRFVRETFNKKSANKEDQNPIKDNLLMIINNDYVYNYYGCEENGTIINVPDNVIMNELLRFYKMIIC